MADDPTIFLSTVSKEPLSIVSAEFEWLRLQIAALCQKTKRVHVRHQKDITSGGRPTLHELENQVAKSDVVVHVIGKQSGWPPPVNQVEDLLQRHPKFETQFPELMPAARAGEITATQWEAWLTLFLEKQLLSFQFGEDDALNAAQLRHLEWLSARGLFPINAQNEIELLTEVFVSLVNEGLVSEQEARSVIHLPLSPLTPGLFKGRDAAMKSLRQGMVEHRDQNKGGVQAIVGKAVHGLGGIGKTRLAVEYAWKYAHEYTAILFVVAESPTDLNANLAALCAAGNLDLPEREAAQDVAVAAVREWLAAHPGWLLILDNADTPEAAAAAEELLPKLQGGEVILTSRQANFSPQIKTMELELLKEEDAVEFLLERTEGKRRATDDDRQQALEIARELDGLALALEQAGAHICKRRMTLAGYRQAWQDQHQHVLQFFDSRVMQYKASVAKTWRATFQALSAPAQELLRRLAWFGPEPIPESLLDVAAAALTVNGENEGGDENENDMGNHSLATQDALAELSDWSLVTRDASEPQFSVHGLVQDVTRCEQQAAGETSLSAAAHWMDDAFVGNGQDVRAWPVLDPLAPHARAVARFADEAGMAVPTSRLLGRLGTLLSGKALHAEAENLERRGLGN